MNFDAEILKLAYMFNGFGLILYVIVTSFISAFLDKIKVTSLKYSKKAIVNL